MIKTVIQFLHFKLNVKYVFFLYTDMQFLQFKLKYYNSNSTFCTFNKKNKQGFRVMNFIDYSFSLRIQRFILQI